jgi:NADH:ubiquinone oxidoreductase subunit H
MTFNFDTTTFWITLLLIAAALGAVLGTVAYLILLERKIAAWVQDRFGPNRVGPWGLLQPIADGLKFLLKEEVIPTHVDRIFYMLAPAVALATALLAFAVVPFGPTTPPPQLIDHRGQVTASMWLPRQSGEDEKAFAQRAEAVDGAKQYPIKPIWPQTKQEEEEVLRADREWARQAGVKPFKSEDPEAPSQLKEYKETVQFVITPHVDIGVVWVFAIGSLAVYAIVLGGWSSNSKYSFLGSLRSSAQLISYEIPMGMAVLGVMLITGSLNMERMIDYQARNGWNVLFQPLAALLFAVSIFAECNRVPFDLPECEQELVGGYHTEYSAMKFACFFLGEYTHMITTSFVMIALFFGGWHLPWVLTPEMTGVGAAIAKLIVFSLKMILFIVFYMLVRWTLPRFRFDQLMSLAWKVMMPLALVSLVIVLIFKQFEPDVGWSPWLMLPLSVLVLIGAAALSLRVPKPRPRDLTYVRGLGGKPAPERSVGHAD